MCATPIKGEPRLCPECQTPIATLRCSHCYHGNLPSAVMCTGCGHALGLEPIGEPDSLSCPDCQEGFHRFTGNGGVLRDCESCGGQFVEHALLKALLEERESYGKLAPRPPRGNPLDSPVRYVRCPACNEVMSRRNFGQSSGIIVDICQAHGTWFDAGELPRVLAFVEAGGLAEMRAREEEQRRHEERRARVREVEARLAPLKAPARMRGFGRFRQQTELADAGMALLDFVSTLLR